MSDVDLFKAAPSPAVTAARTLREAAADRRAALDNLHDCARVEHEAVWLALDAGWSWQQIANLLGVSMLVALHRHRDRGRWRL